MPDSSPDAIPGMGPDIMADTETRWLSYDDLAKALGITPDSARRLVARKRWPRRPGNDGRALIAVPTERLAQDRSPAVVDNDAPAIRADVSPDADPDSGNDITPVVRVLSQHIEKLERQLEAAQAELREERTRSATLALQAAQVDALNAVLEAERRRVEDLKAERDRWAAQTDPLKTTIEALKASLDAERGRLSELREERDRWRTAATARRSWWPWRRSA
jgi:hypothetical protein